MKMLCIFMMFKSSKIVKQFLGHWKMHGIFGALETARFLWSLECEAFQTNHEVYGTKHGIPRSLTGGS